MKNKLIIITVLSIIAFFNAFYLSYDWLFTVENAKSLYFPVGNITGGGSFCDINNTLSCSSVLQNPLSQIFGIPFPIFAMIVYPIIALIAIIGLIKKTEKTVKILFILGLFGILFNGYFIYQETFNIGAFCPLCLLCSLIIITISGISFSEIIKKNKVG